MKPIYCLNGPNLNLLGTREPEIYGTTTLSDIEGLCQQIGAEAGFEVIVRQSNSEGDLVDWVQEAGHDGSAIVINAAAYTHTSVALHDALKAVSVPKIEVHLSNPAKRDDFRQINFIASAVEGSIAGLGAYGYVLAINAAVELATPLEGQKQ